MQPTKDLLISLMLCFVFSVMIGQEENETTKSNIQEYTPSKLLNKGKWDVKFFNSIYTQTKQTDSGSKPITIPRQNFFTNTTEVYTGVSSTSRINVGLIIQARANTYGGAGALDVFKFENNKTGSRSGLTIIAPSIRVQPFTGLASFSITSSVFFPIFKDKYNPYYLDKRSVFWETKLFYDKTFGDNKWQVFTELDLGFNFGKKAINENNIDIKELDFNNIERFANNSLALPVSVFLSYFPSPKSTLFVNTQQSILIDLGNNFSQNYTSIGLGGKYQVTKVLNVEASFGKFVRGRNFQGLGQTFSLGLRALL